MIDSIASAEVELLNEYLNWRDDHLGIGSKKTPTEPLPKAVFNYFKTRRLL